MIDINMQAILTLIKSIKSAINRLQYIGNIAQPPTIVIIMNWGDLLNLVIYEYI